jgi:hypothetical protein
VTDIFPEFWNSHHVLGYSKKGSFWDFLNILWYSKKTFSWEFLKILWYSKRSSSWTFYDVQREALREDSWFLYVSVLEQKICTRKLERIDDMVRHLPPWHPTLYAFALQHLEKERKNSKISQPKPQSLDAHTIRQESYWNILLVLSTKSRPKSTMA